MYFTFPLRIQLNAFININHVVDEFREYRAIISHMDSTPCISQIDLQRTRVYLLYFSLYCGRVTQSISVLFRLIAV